MVNIDQFLELVDLYAEKEGVARTVVSFRLFNDSKRIGMLRDDADRDVGIRKVERAVQFLSDNWPSGVAWPKAIARPAPARAET